MLELFLFVAGGVAISVVVWIWLIIRDAQNAPPPNPTSSLLGMNSAGFFISPEEESGQDGPGSTQG